MSTPDGRALERMLAQFEESATHLSDSVLSFVDSEAPEHAQAVRDDINACQSWLNKLRRLVPR